MSMQIHSIVLFSRSGKTRAIKFRLNAVNIITGRSRTGKTALLDIIDYCLGRTTCNVPEGVIRDSVAWYALVLQFPETQAFVARRSPDRDANTSPECMLQLAKNIVVPDAEALQANVNVQGMSDAIGNLIGITPNENVPKAGQTRAALRATLDHSKFLIFQGQSEIANRDFLFHRQGEPFIPQAIKDTLPYFLGAVADTSLMLRARLRDAKQELQRLERKRLEEEQISGSGETRDGVLVSEAREVGLLSDSSSGSARQLLRSLATARIGSVPSQSQTGIEANTLRSELAALRRQYQDLQDQIQAANSFNEAESLFGAEAQIQQSRLETVSLFPPHQGSQQSCPLCQQDLAEPIPATTELQSSLNQLRQDLAGVGTRRPRVDDFLNNLRGQIAQVRGDISARRERLNAIEAQDNQFQLNVELERRQAHVIGRVSLYLETVPDVAADASIPRRIAELEKEIETLSAELNDEAVQEAVESALSRISKWMTEGATALELEYQPNPYRIDLGHLTVVSDTEDRPVRMNQMGSAENWLGCHLVSHIALHRWFATKNRPVPRFLFIDQPTSAYYPPDDAGQGRDEDRAAVARMYQWLISSVADAKQKFQLLIVDHADLQEKWFKDSVVERWRGKNALIPADWLENADGK